MSASTQFSQLDMWKPAHELVNDVAPSDAASYGGVNPMWTAKRNDNANAENTGRGVSVDDVKQNGVLNPVYVWHNKGRETISDGHHRAIAAYDANPNTLVPVEHDWNGAR